MRARLAILAAVLLAWTLTPCAGLAADPDMAPFVEKGAASWISRNFEGEPTASSEIYDPDALTAAHNYLPLGTMIMVTNLENNKTVTLRVNDRGPFAPDRIIDVSWAAAERLGVVSQGGKNLKFTFPVLVRAMGVIKTDAGPASTAAPPPDALFYIQAGAFSQAENAHALVKALRAKGFDNFRVIDKIRGERRLYKVQVGPFEKLEKAKAGVKKVRTETPGAFVISDVVRRER